MGPKTLEQYREETLKAWVANRKRQEELTAKRRFEAGEFSIELIPTPDDPPVGDPLFQRELSGFSASLRAASVPFLQTAVRLDSVDAHGYPLPEFIVAIKELGVPVIVALAGAAGAWAQARYGRKVRLKIGDIEAEGRTVAEVEALLNRAAKFQGELGKGDGE